MFGKIVSHHRIFVKLGEGGTGVVCKAEDLKLTRTVALKFLPHGLQSHEPERAHIPADTQADSALKHSGAVHEMREHYGRRFIVMECVNVIARRDKIARTRIRVQQACRPLLALTCSLSLALICGRSIAQPSLCNFPPRELNGSARATGDPVLHTAGWSMVKPEHADEGALDSTSIHTGTSIGSAVYYFYEPFPMEPGSSVIQIGGSFSLLPIPDAEQELPIPALDIQYKRGVFDNVAVVGSLSTCIYSNLVHAGIQWNTRLDRFSCGLAGHIGVAYGFITKENLFDHVEGYGVFDMLILRLGYRFDDFSFSCSFVSTYLMKSMSYVNGLEASVGPQHTINDLYCTLAVEQPFLRNLHLSIGFSLGYARTPYQTWMFYNTIDEWLFTPEFFFAVQL